MLGRVRAALGLELGELVEGDDLAQRRQLAADGASFSRCASSSANASTASEWREDVRALLAVLVG